jgi:serine/threonine protein kinase
MSPDELKEKETAPSPEPVDSAAIKSDGVAQQAQTSDFCSICGIVKIEPSHQCFQDADYLSIDPDADPLIGKIVGHHYKILAFIGRGGMSTVFRASHQLMKKIVALKVLTPQFRLDKQKLSRFQQEAISVGRLNHKNIIKIYEFEVPEVGEPYLVMDLIEGSSLSEALSKGPLSLRRALNIFEQICDALAHAHDMGVIHRDLKPSNIMLVRDEGGDEIVKIVDFGIAKILTPEIAAAKLTQTGDIFGSPFYMSPEQSLGKSLDSRSDIYSLGCLMYESLTGKVPFEGTSVLETINKHLYEPPPLTSQSGANIERSAPMNAIILKCLAKSPQQRYQTMDQLRKDLQKVANSEKENPLERLHLAWRLHNLRKHTHWPSLGSPQAFVSIIATLLFITAITVWQKSSMRNAQRLHHSPATASDIVPEKQFYNCMTAGQEKFDDGDWDSANSEFRQFLELRLSPQEQTRLSPLVFEQLRDLHYAAGQLKSAENYAMNAKKIRTAAANDIVKSVKRELSALEKELKEHPHARTDLSDALGDINEQAHLCEYLCAYDQAKEILELNLALSLRYMPKNNSLDGRTYKNLAHVLWQRGELKEARDLYEKALVIRHRERGYFDEDLIRTLRDAAALDLQMKNYRGAHRYLDEAIAEAKSSDNINTPLMAYLHVLRARVSKAGCEPENVESELQEAKNIYAQTPIDNLVYDQKASWLTLLAQSETANSDNQLAIRKRLRDAISLYEQAPRKDWADFADSLDELAKNYLWEANQPSAEPQVLRAQQVARAYPLIKRAQAICSRLSAWQTGTVASASDRLLSQYESAVQQYAALPVDMHPGHMHEQVVRGK